ncbi:MAG: S1C family serine protease [Puniceicoccales bacterium]|jgi:serine protease Do|nr:S1C family serine protease [Puniceicoccales bacterium]
MRHWIAKSLFLVSLFGFNRCGLTVVQASEHFSAGVQFLQDVYEKNRASVVLVRYQTKEKEPQLATGFFVSPQGHLLTTASEGEDYCIEIDKRIYAVTKLGSDVIANVALLKLDCAAEQIAYLNIPDACKYPDVGEGVVSLSYKLALNVSPQLGYVTGLNDRYLGIEWPTTLMRSTLGVDGGDCGGPVFDMSGHLAGMLLYALSETKETYFMPAYALNKIYHDLLLFGRVRYGYVGMTVEVVLDKEQQQLYLQVVAVQDNSPAQKAGIRVGDVLLEFDAMPVNSRDTFKNFVFFAQPKQKLRIKILRHKKGMLITVVVEEKDRSCGA